MEPFPNAPIKEAIVEFKINPLPESNLEILESLHEKIKNDYPQKRAKHRWESSMKVENERMVSSTQRHIGQDGFLFQSDNNEQVVQFTLDGFTFNRLRPYPPEGWPVIREEAHKLSSLFLDSISPTKIIRVGLRYINQIDIPLSNVDLTEYLTKGPDIPQDLPQALEQYLTRIVIPIPEFGAKAIITQAGPQKPSPSVTSLILDIDVFSDVNLVSRDNSKIWEIFDRLRDLKNRIFRASITPKAEELFQ